jgi:hypothetical protein
MLRCTIIKLYLVHCSIGSQPAGFSGFLDHPGAAEKKRPASPHRRWVGRISQYRRCNSRNVARILASRTPPCRDQTGRSGLVLPGSSASVMRRRWPSSGIAVWRELARDFCGSKRCSVGGQTSNTIAHFALDFERKESVCGDHGWRASISKSAPCR